MRSVRRVALTGSGMYHRPGSGLLSIVTTVIDNEGLMSAADPAALGGGIIRPREPTDSSPWRRAAERCRAWESGDNEALSDLVRVMSPIMWQVARACRLSANDAEDVVQTTWMALVRSGGVHDADAVAGWLLTTTRREAWRVAGRGQRTTAVDDEDLESMAENHPSAEEAAVQHDEHARLWHAVGRLDDRCRMLLRIIAFSDRPDYAGIAHDLDMPVGSIGPTRQRCLRKLRRHLDEQGEEA